MRVLSLCCVRVGMQVGMYARLTDMETLLTAAPVEG